jgi:hypothetical protein
MALVCSLVANLALASALIWKNGGRTKEAVTPPAITELTPSAGAVRLDWSSVEASDYEQYVKNLRAIGCPEETIYDIVVADVSTMFAMRARTEIPSKTWKYWDPQDAVPTRDEIRNQRLRRELEQEKQELIVRILGPEALKFATKYDLWGGEAEADRKLAFLPESKRAGLEDIQSKFHQLEQAATDWDANGAVTEAAQQRIADLEKQERSEIAAVLTPDELLDYDLRTSPAAERLRAELNGFHPTEQEFRQLYTQRKAYEDQLNAAVDVRDRQVLAAREQTQEQIAQQLKTSMGAARYGEYLRSADIDYQNALHVTNYLGKPEQVAGGIYDLKLRNDAAANQAAASTALTPAQRQAAFDQLRADAETQLKALLGDTGFATYLESNRWWMRDQ